MRPKPLTPGTQNYRIERYLARGRRITAFQALVRFGCFRLASRIKELKRHGYKIGREMVQQDGKSFAEYFMKAARR